MTARHLNNWFIGCKMQIVFEENEENSRWNLPVGDSSWSWCTEFKTINGDYNNIPEAAKEKAEMRTDKRFPTEASVQNGSHLWTCPGEWSPPPHHTHTWTVRHSNQALIAQKHKHRHAGIHMSAFTSPHKLKSTPRPRGHDWLHILLLVIFQRKHELDGWKQDK